MMSTAPPFLLTRDQAMRLHGYIQTYRQYAFTTVLPSTERNTTLRVLQALEGKLIEVMDQQTVPLQLLLTREELAALRAMTAGLLMLSAKQPDSAGRTRALGDLAALRASLKN